MTRKSSKVGFSIQLAALLLAASASAVQVVGRESAEMAWEPASGPVDAYGVFISRDGEDFSAVPEQFVSEPRATVEGALGQVLLVRVAAFDAAGNQGPFSPTSEPVEFVASSEPDPDSPEGELVYYEDFGSYAGRDDPEGWVDTAAGNSLVADPALFETFEFGDGNVVFGTSSVDSDIHSHYLVEGSDQWSSYEYSGRVRIEHPDGGAGVTLYSGYDTSDSYYRLQRQGGSSFSVDSHGAGGIDCAGAADTGVVPYSGAWYWFRFQAFATAWGTRLRAKIWHEADEEPIAWQVECVDESPAPLVAGAFGVWSMGSGEKYWDDLEVRFMFPDPDEGDPNDADGDGWLDGDDNCLIDANPDQRDTDSDGFGNLCDGDFDNNGYCDGGDFEIFRQSYGAMVPPGNPDTDMDGNGTVEGTDFGFFGAEFGGFPGPSGLACAGTVPCP